MKSMPKSIAILYEHPEWFRPLLNTDRPVSLAEEYGLEILDDWSDELKARYGITL